MPEYTGEPYRRRTWIRSHEPKFLINLGLFGKGQDCEEAGGSHEWYNIDNENSGCYHCSVLRKGKLWQEMKT